MFTVDIKQQYNNNDLFVTHHLVMVIICGKLFYFQIPSYMTSYKLDTNKIQWSLCIKLKCQLWPWPLTQQHGSCSWHFILSWWSFVPYYFQIPPCLTKLWVWHKQVLLKPMHKVKCGMWPWPLTQQHGSCSWHIVLSWCHLSQIIFKSHHAGQNYGPDKILEHTNENTHKYTHTG